MIKGSLEAFKDAPPLIRIVAPVPGAPPPALIETPAIRPFNKLSALTLTPLLKSLAASNANDPVASFF